MRSRYKQEYSVLQLNCITLILHLSFCDLLYALLGFPHFIHSHIYKTNIYSEEVCYFLGMFRNLVAYTDFNNVAHIACCLARQFLCRYKLNIQYLEKIKLFYCLDNAMVVFLNMMVMTFCLEEGECSGHVWDCGYLHSWLFFLILWG